MSPGTGGSGQWMWACIRQRSRSGTSCRQRWTRSGRRHTFTGPWGSPCISRRRSRRWQRTSRTGTGNPPGRRASILDFLDREIPSDWDSLSRQQRQMFWNGNPKLADGTELVPREKVCAVEIWVECFGGEPKHMKRTDSMEINNIPIGLKGWERIKTPRRFGVYGQQRGFCRAKT